MSNSSYESVLHKQELVDAISDIALGSKKYTLGRGSSIPSMFFQDLENKFGVPRSGGMDSKAATFCDYFGVAWTQECDSANSKSGGGGTVTRYGLLQLLEAVKIALRKSLD